MNIKCFDVVSIVVEEATKQYSPDFVLNDNKLRILKQYCDAIDYIKDEINATEYEAEIIDDNKTVSISIECSNLFVDSVNHAFCHLLRRSIACTLSYVDDDTFKINFIFPSLWDSAEGNGE